MEALMIVNIVLAPKVGAAKASPTIPVIPETIPIAEVAMFAFA